MNSIEQLKVALGEPLKKNIGGQEFEFYPLEVTELVTFSDISQRASDEKLNKEDMIELANLIVKMVKKAFPKDTPENLINQFVIKYFFQLQEILTELHSPDTEKLSDNQKSRLEQLKAKVRKNVKPSGEDQAESSS